jgi:hypothetical protein
MSASGVTPTLIQSNAALSINAALANKRLTDSDKWREEMATKVARNRRICTHPSNQLPVAVYDNLPWWWI